MLSQTLQVSYGHGSVQDLPRHMLPAGAVWKYTDYMPDLDGAPLGKRGGWGLATGVLPGASSLVAVAWAPFAAGDQVVSIDDRGHLFAGDVDKGVGVIPISRPVFFQNQLIIPGSRVKKYDGVSAPASLVNAPIGARWAATYKSRLVLAEGDTIHFSNVSDAETYDVDSFVGVTDPISGLAAMSNMIAVFSKGRSERLRGTTPPSSTSAGDFVLEPMFPEGCIDARSIVVYNDQVIWANENGIHISDGAAISNLIAVGGLQRYWTELMRDFDDQTWSLAGGYYGGFYVISIMNGSTIVDALACNLSTKTWLFLNNLPVRMFSEAFAAAPELYMALTKSGAVSVGSFSGCLTPDSSNKNDGDGTPVQPSIEFPYFRGGTVQQRWRELFLGVDLDTDDGAILELAYADQITGDYKTLSDSQGGPRTIEGTSGYEKERIPFHVSAQGFGLKVTQVGASNHTRLFDLEANVREREGRF